MKRSWQRNTKEKSMCIIGCIGRLSKLLLFIGSLSRIYADDQSANGQHILVLPIEVTPFLLKGRNATGHVIGYSGNSVLALEWISKRLNFSYKVLDDQVFSMEDTSIGKGATSYLMQGKTDLVWTTVGITSARYSKVDYPYVYMISPFGLLIPMPSLSTDTFSIWKPLQPSVWKYLLISLLVIIVYIYLMHSTKYLARENDSLTHRRNIRMASYTIKILMSQGGVYPSKRTSIRLLFGGWCLALLVLGKAYSSVLVSFITLPIYVPLINSVSDISKTSGVRVTVEKDKGVDVFFRGSEVGINKFIGDMLREQPQLRCPNVDNCLDRVRSIGSDVYVHRVEVLLDLMGRDYKKMNRCDFAIAKETFSSYYQASMFAMVKNGPYTREFNKEFIKAESVGLFQVWWKMTTSDPTRCVNAHRDQEADVSALTMGHLSGAFVVLVVGFGLAFLVFMCELIYRLYQNQIIVPL